MSIRNPRAPDAGYLPYVHTVPQTTLKSAVFTAVYMVLCKLVIFHVYIQ